MVFTEFYNSIFELVDNFTKTALPQEYSVFIDMIDEWVKETEWLQEYINNSPDLNLNSTKKTQYHHWMSQLLSDNSIEVQQSAIAQHSTRDLKVVDYLPINKSRKGKHNRSGRRRSFRHSDARLSVEPKPTPKNSRKQVHSDTIKPSPKSSSKADLFRRSPVHAKAGGIVLGSNSARHLAVRRNIL